MLTVVDVALERLLHGGQPLGGEPERLRVPRRQRLGGPDGGQEQRKAQNGASERHPGARPTGFIEFPRHVLGLPGPNLYAATLPQTPWPPGTTPSSSTPKRCGGTTATSLAFFFPDIERDVDWARGYESLDKELPKLERDAATGGRYADKLTKVWRGNGEERLVFIHVEVQGDPDHGFPRRMYVYNYRIYDRHQQPVVSLAILADDRPG